MSRAAGGFLEQRVRVLVVDQLAKDREVMGRFLTAWNFEPLTAATAGEALQLAGAQRATIAIIAEPVAGMPGMELVHALRRSESGVETILLAEDESAGYATAAFRSGAYSCLQRPVDFKQLGHDLNTLRDALQRRHERMAWEHSAANAPVFEGMVGFSAPMQAVFASIRRFAAEDGAVLITGLIGSGKELVARALHKGSARSGRPLVVYRCCGVSEALAGLELFGEPHGGAQTQGETVRPEQPGSWRSASGGTLLLDEIGDLPLAMQRQLAAFLMEAAQPSPVRLLAATRLNLADLAVRGQFDVELYGLLSRNVIYLPSLGERPEDVPMLCRYFLETFNREYGKSVRGFSSAAERVLMTYAWPGNVRELENVIGRACLLADSDRIEVSDLSIVNMPDRSGWTGQPWLPSPGTASGRIKRKRMPARVRPAPGVN
jgi:DNA-binding NtrC family response regulator